MFDEIEKVLRDFFDAVSQAVSDIYNELAQLDLSNIEPYSPRARPTHWQRTIKPKTKPHTRPVLFRKRIFHCRNCLPFVLKIAEVEE